MSEIWKDVLGYEGSYQCSSQGRVRSIDRYVASKSGSTRMSKGIILAIKLTKRGYNSVGLCVHQKIKWALVHRLVYEAFNGKTNLQIDHINDIPTDCRLSNLQALSSHDNNLKAKARKPKTSIYPGVHKVARNEKWRAQIGRNGKKYNLGLFNTQEEAHAAYLKARSL